MRSSFLMYAIAAGAALAMAGSLAGCKRDDAEKDMPAAESSVKPAPAVTGSVSQGAAPKTQQAPARQEQSKKVDEYAPIIIRPKAEYELTSDYTCNNGTRFVAVFTRNPDGVRITFPGRVTVSMPKKNVRGAGFWYESDLYEFVGRGTQARWIMKGRNPVECRVMTYEERTQ